MTGKTFTADTRYGTQYSAVGTTPTRRRIRLPQAVRIQNLYAACSVNPSVPATVTLRTGSDSTTLADTAIRCTIPTTGPARCADVADVVDVPAGT